MPATDGSSPALSVRHLTKRYKAVTAVDDLSFDVPAGEFFGFLGPNGAGKTTTINAVVGLATFQGGSISVFGHDVITDYRRSRTLIGLSPQEFNFDRYLTIEEILTYQGGYYGMPLAIAKPRAAELLEQFELSDKRRNSYLELSGGMKRRLSLARALIHKPRLLILDEPTAGMDVELRLELWDFLKAINADGMTIMMTSHYLEEVEALCNRIGIVNGGRLVKLEDKETLMSSHGQDSLQDIFLDLVGRRSRG
ncbi:MAG: ABC transporter ATP-binding protein [Candidatus Eremiobacter antarcticus]|nr:ABC transporter ATP-binding protein [Candidatus Eremiobacteraeota bacterium]MBC5808716.1 ABC transporter ATP-binding protein [Candidatus Eremiobacteraeota bacterium]PZR62247.1 MAG: ABC transporter ATP-binding protein [Candidatus Eremiobacter sp. RRmetagenome_bin22]